MKITKDNFTLHNIKRFLLAYKRKFQIWLFSQKVVTSLFKDNDSIKEFLEAPKHIREQFIWRLEQMKQSKQGRECLANGECVCGCSVPDLQLTDDACEHNCYPPMMDEKKWNTFKIQNHFQVDLDRQRVYKYIV